jgi:hypothetical protein
MSQSSTYEYPEKQEDEQIIQLFRQYFLQGRELFEKAFFSYEREKAVS